ncbi:MAG TPA: hypothetical protein ENH91_08270 [Leeuwenhoekiella sp.]|nr:hypothetical protein [Leeuwenhoekiella sp.]
MKKTVFTIDNEQVAFSKSLLGGERIYVDDREVSKKFSLGSTTHFFKVGAENFQLKSIYETFNFKNIKLELNRNGKKIDSTKLDIKKIILTHRVIQIFLGIVLYQLLVYSIQLF